MKMAIKNGWILTGDTAGTQFSAGDIVIKNGIIEDICKETAVPDLGFDRVIDARGKIVLPGLVNAHMHSYANLTKGSADTLPLEMWMLYITAMGRLLSPEDIYYSALLGIAEMLKTGTTACIDHLAQNEQGLEAAMQAYALGGIRAAMAPMITDKHYADTLPLERTSLPEDFSAAAPPPARELIDTTVRLYKNWNGKDGRLTVLFGPSGPQRCSDDLLKTCASLAAEYDTVLHTHVLETRAQAETALKLYGKPMVLHLEAIGALTCKTSFAHGVWLTEPEVRTAAQRNVVIVHNPASNLRIGSGRAPIERYRKAGLRIALGTDGANVGGGVNLFESMRLAAILHTPFEPDPERWIRPEEALQMAALNGALAAGMEKDCGSLEIGKKADVVILNPRRSYALIPLDHPLRQIVYGETGSGVETVIVGGRVVVENGSITTFDENRVFDEVQKRIESLQARFLEFKGSVDGQAAFLRKALLTARQSV